MNCCGRLPGRCSLPGVSMRIVAIFCIITLFSVVLGRNDGGLHVRNLLGGFSCSISLRILSYHTLRYWNMLSSSSNLLVCLALLRTQVH